MLSSRHGRPPITLILIVLVLCTLFYYFRPAIGGSSTAALGGASNATLGFGGLYVVSGPGSPRRRHLEQAAAVTELQLTILQQIAWTDADVAAFQVENQTESKIGVGSVKAWLSHHLVLKAFLESGLETALIFEDDVDWDIRLRTQQIPRAQRAARSLSSVQNLVKSQYPWGMPSDWDLLYLGHCGDYFSQLPDIGLGYHHPFHLKTIEHVAFDDPTIINRGDLHPFTASLFTALEVPDRQRLLHASQWPLCTFGYAITRASAEKIMKEVAPAKENPKHLNTAFDAALLAGCRDKWTPWSIKCYSVQPELFHHMPGKSIIALAEETEEHHVFPPPVDAKGEKQVAYRGETSNINCGFWSGEFYYDNEKELEYLRNEVGRKGRCLKKGRDPTVK